MKRQSPGLRRTANVLLSAVLALGLSPVSAFAQVADAPGAAAGSAAPTLIPPVSFEPVAPQSVPAPANDAQAAAQAAPAAAPAAPADAAAPAVAALTPGWTQADTCEWMIDAAGKLTVRPLGNGTSGNLGANPAGGDQSAPWCDQSKTITSVVI